MRYLPEATEIPAVAFLALLRHRATGAGESLSVCPGFGVIGFPRFQPTVSRACMPEHQPVPDYASVLFCTLDGTHTEDKDYHVQGLKVRSRQWRGEPDHASISHEIDHGTTVFVNGQAIVRTGDKMWMNWKKP